jgi:hypothetical protein
VSGRGYRSGMTHTGMRPPPDPDDPMDIEPRSDVESVPDEEDLDAAQVEEDLAQEPDEKRNATDGYAPADEEPDD